MKPSSSTPRGGPGSVQGSYESSTESTQVLIRSANLLPRVRPPAGHTGNCDYFSAVPEEMLLEVLFVVFEEDEFKYPIMEGRLRNSNWWLGHDDFRALPLTPKLPNRLANISRHRYAEINPLHRYPGESFRIPSY